MPCRNHKFIIGYCSSYLVIRVKLSPSAVPDFDRERRPRRRRNTKSLAISQMTCPTGVFLEYGWGWGGVPGQLIVLHGTPDCQSRPFYMISPSQREVSLVRLHKQMVLWCLHSEKTRVWKKEEQMCEGLSDIKIWFGAQFRSPVFQWRMSYPRGMTPFSSFWVSACDNPLWFLPCSDSNISSVLLNELY